MSAKVLKVTGAHQINRNVLTFLALKRQNKAGCGFMFLTQSCGSNLPNSTLSENNCFNTFFSLYYCQCCSKGWRGKRNQVYFGPSDLNLKVPVSRLFGSFLRSSSEKFQKIFNLSCWTKQSNSWGHEPSRPQSRPENFPSVVWSGSTWSQTEVTV